MKILFLNMSALKFSAATPDYEPLGGSESCVAYLAQQLATNGHDVTLVARLPDGFSGETLGIKHHPHSAIKNPGFFAAEKFDVIVTCNAPIAAPFLREASPSSRIFLWDHVTPEQPSMRELGNAEILNALDGIIYVSEWQKQQTEKHFGFSKTGFVIGNGLTPTFENLFSSPQEILKAKQLRAAYTTTPFRGLAILLEAVKGLDIELDVFSSMRVYQMDDAEYQPLYAAAKSNPRVHYHGSVTQKELAQKLKSASLLTYPSIFEETFCISALEAMACGMKVIATDTGALKTTTMGYADLMPMEKNLVSFTANYRTLIEQNIAAFRASPEAWAARMYEQSIAVNRSCNWRVRAQEWEKLFAQR
ncbi:MAG TPA: glycosyltransferase family 4 protein [Alphaproteobacteria bacterium]|nr:glycosyltransferase family 4 protein [Alphaproteobacteria bacterium]